jgi:hypothetical protein
MAFRFYRILIEVKFLQIQVKCLFHTNSHCYAYGPLSQAVDAEFFKWLCPEVTNAFKVYPFNCLFDHSLILGVNET